jgi:hypothetical protein
VNIQTGLIAAMDEGDCPDESQQLAIETSKMSRWILMIWAAQATAWFRLHSRIVGACALDTDSGERLVVDSIHTQARPRSIQLVVRKELGGGGERSKQRRKNRLIQSADPVRIAEQDRRQSKFVQIYVRTRRFRNMTIAADGIAPARNHTPMLGTPMYGIQTL